MEFYDASRRCGGTFYNGPGKRYARCDRCRRIDWEANEGDRCKRPALLAAEEKEMSGAESNQRRSSWPTASHRRNHEQ